MTFFIGFFVAFLCTVFVYLPFHTSQVPYSKCKRILVICIVFISSYLVFISICSNVTSIINITKLSIALICLSGAAAVDYQEYRIPNVYSFVLATSGVTCLAIGCLMHQDGAKEYVLGSIVATFVTTFVFMIIMIATRSGIGFGDVKILCALAIAGGVHLICSTICVAILACAIYSMVGVILKKKTLQSVLPFGPFILFGYIVTILMAAY